MPPKKTLCKMTAATEAKSIKRPRRVFGRVRFKRGEDTFVATMGRTGVVIRKLHSRQPRLLEFGALLDALESQYRLGL